MNVSTPTFQIWPMPKRLKALGTAAPTATSKAAAKQEATGQSAAEGRIGVALAGAETVTLRIYCEAMNKWILCGAGETDYSKEFAENSMDVFDVPPYTLFHLQATAGAVNAYVSAKEPS